MEDWCTEENNPSTPHQCNPLPNSCRGHHCESHLSLLYYYSVPPRSLMPRIPSCLLYSVAEFSWLTPCLLSPFINPSACPSTLICVRGFYASSREQNRLVTQPLSRTLLTPQSSTYTSFRFSSIHMTHCKESYPESNMYLYTITLKPYNDLLIRWMFYKK